jgi:hypothetical protein
LSTTACAPLRCFAVGLALLLLWGSGEAVAFAVDISQRKNLSPCAADGVDPGPNLTVIPNYRAWWGRTAWGFERGGYHCYGGPGGKYLRFGAADFVVEVTYPHCS